MRKSRLLNIIPVSLLLALLALSQLYAALIWWAFGLSFAAQLLIVVYGCISLKSGYFIPVVWHAQTQEKAVVLSFDDGPHPTLSPVILDTLKEYGVHADFFCIGRNIPGNEAVLRRMHEEGHTIGNHSYSHDFWFDLFSSRKMLADMQQMDEAVVKTIGVRPLLFRPPYGVMNPSLKRAILKGKYIPIGWSVRSFDTQIKDKQKLLSRITGTMRPGDIILLHDSMQVSADMLPELIETIQNKGYRILRLNEMINIKVYG